MSLIESSIDAIPYATGELEEPVRQTQRTEVVVSSSYFRWKPAASRVVGCILILPALPLIAVLVAMMRMTSEGPGFFSQIRVGKDGKHFKMYKIRTMRNDAEKSTGAVWSVPGDPRVTKVGRFIRDRHMDELPQLWNVVRGEMDLFGPRPERPEFTEFLSDTIRDYKKRLQVLPGVTGLAQINLPPDQDLDDVRRKLELDLEYIQKANFWLDARMFIATTLRLFGIPGDAVMRWARVQREVHLPQSTEAASEPSSQPNNRCSDKAGVPREMVESHG